MTLESRKILFIQEFLQLQNEEIIFGLEALLRKRNVEDSEQNFQPMSINQFNFEIDASMLDSKNGEIISTMDLKNRIKSLMINILKLK